MLAYLYDLPKDVAICTTIANYRTPSGDQLDGLAPDVEFNIYADDVTTFAEVLRTQIAPDRIHPAGSWVGQHHPIALTLSRWFNALAPMVYWHEMKQHERRGLALHRASVDDVRKAVGDPRFQVAPIGQTYDSFSRNGAGPNSPRGRGRRSAQSREGRRRGRRQPVPMGHDDAD